MIGALLASFAIVGLAEVVLFAYLGLLAASSARLPLVVGVLAGAFFSFVGVLVVYVVGFGRGAGARVRAAAPASSGTSPLSSPWGQPAPPGAAATPAFSSGAGFGPARGSAGSQPVSSFGAGFGSAPGTSASGFSAGPAFGAASPPVAGEHDNFSTSGVTTGRRELPSLIAAVLVLLMLVSIGLSWGTGRIAWSPDHEYVSDGLAPYDFVPVLLAIVFTAMIIGAAALLFRSQPRGLWLGAAATVVTFWFCLLASWVLLDSEFGSVSDQVNGLTDAETKLSFAASIGAWLMFAACIGVYAWVTWLTAVLIRTRRSTGQEVR